MRYDCPKCGASLRFRFKGFFRLVCPHCSVPLYRTQSSGERTFSTVMIPLLWVFAVPLTFVLWVLLGGSPLFWLAFGVCMVLLGTWLLGRANNSTSKDWPRWTDQRPW